METTPDQKDRLRTIISNLLSGDKQWFDKQEILVGDKGPYWILNYRQGGRNEFNQLVRGLIVRKPDGRTVKDPLELIASFPFIRFYNRGEKDAAPVDFTQAEMLEKLDGSMVGVFFPDGDPHMPQYHTRKMISVHQPDMDMTISGFEKTQGKQYPFMRLIGGYVHGLKFSKQDVEYTYVFEFIHEASKVLTQYPPERYGLHLLGARNLRTHRELTEDQLDPIAVRIGSFRPRRWQASADEATIKQLMDEIEKGTKDFEGAVFRDKVTGHRVKLKRDDYVKLHHLLDKLSYKHLIPKILEGEADEILAYFPSAKERVELFQRKYGTYVNQLVAHIKKYHDMHLSRKLLAQEVFNTPLLKDKFQRGMVMKHYEEDDEKVVRTKVDQALRDIALGKGNNDGSPKRLMELLAIEDDEDEKRDEEL